LYEWAEHTAELELRIEASSPREVFAEALAAFAELVDGGAGEPSERRVWLTASDRAALLAQWLEELVFLAETEDFVPERADPLDVGSKELRAHVHGHNGSPRPLVKAVTYHGLELRRQKGAWRARVVLDV
jgi:SHS2 domain-containing protein